jgi:Ran GTPase-activating protein (RanGAP) involved in mRNA processing and transport
MTLQALTIEDADITDEGALSLSIGLQSNILLHGVALPRNQLTTAGLEHLIDCLDVNSNLTDLDLRDNLITDVPSSLTSYLQMETSSIRSLCLNGNPLQSKSVAALL